MKNITPLHLVLIIGLILISGCNSLNVNRTEKDAKANIIEKSLSNQNNFSDATNKESGKIQSLEYIEPTIDIENRFIHFYDTLGEIMNSFDIIKNNPFSKLDFLSAGIEYTINFNYDLTNHQLHDIVDTASRAVYNKERHHAIIKPKYACSRTEFVSHLENHFVVAYNLYITEEDGYHIGIKSSLKVLSKSRGEIIYTMDNIDVNVTNASITPDEKYMCITFGVDDEYGSLVFPGYRIYNLQNMEIIHQEFVNSNYSSVNTGLMNGTMVVTYSGPCAQRLIGIFDFSLNTIYFKSLHALQINRIRKITDEGILIDNEEESELVLYDSIIIKSFQ